MDERRRDAAHAGGRSHERRQRRAGRDAADPGVDIGLRSTWSPRCERLPVEQREPLLLVSVEQFSYAECAEALRIPIGTVMSRVSRARAALRAVARRQRAAAQRRAACGG